VFEHRPLVYAWSFVQSNRIDRVICDLEVVGSTPVGLLPRSTQPSIPLWLVNQVLACMAAVKASCIHLCRVVVRCVISYGRWRSVATWWVSYNNVQARCSSSSDTASRLVEAVVEVNVMAVDWLANFSDYGVMTKLRESYEIVKSPSIIRIWRFYDNLTTS